MRLLIVDDSEINRIRFKKVLQSEGHTVEEAENTKQALENSLLAPPDIIISTILMPVMDGFRLCRKLKADNKTCHILIVFYSETDTENEEKEFAFKMGTDRFLIKRMGGELFFRELQGVIKEKEMGENILPKNLLKKDVLQKNKIKAALRETEERFRRLAGNSKDVIYRMSLPDGQFEYISPADWEIIRKKSKDAISLVDSVIQTVKRISAELRPGLLDNLGLSAAIAWQAGEYQKRSGINIHVNIEPEEIFLNENLSIVISRVCQEALTNILSDIPKPPMPAYN
jgi:CheY-like chemotaxis protein